MERDDAWVRAQKELEEERRKKAEAGQQKDGKSLFEVLQQNKSELEPSLCFLCFWLYAGHCEWWRPLGTLSPTATSLGILYGVPCHRLDAGRGCN